MCDNKLRHGDRVTLDLNEWSSNQKQHVRLMDTVECMSDYKSVRHWRLGKVFSTVSAVM